MPYDFLIVTPQVSFGANLRTDGSGYLDTAEILPDGYYVTRVDGALVLVTPQGAYAVGDRFDIESAISSITKIGSLYVVVIAQNGTTPPPVPSGSALGLLLTLTRAA